MPPTGDIAGVQKSGSVLHALGWVLLGVAAGLLIAAAIGYAALSNSLVQNWLRGYVVTASIEPLSAAASTTSAPQALQTFTTASTTIAVPRSYATQEYYVALNSAYFDYANLMLTGNKLAPLFVSLNTKVAAGNYGDVIDIAVQLKSLIAKEKEITALFGQHLAELSTANQSSKDAVTKSLTQDLISAGNVFRDSLPPYLNALDSMFSGQTPSSDELARIAGLAQTAAGSLQNFKAKLQILLDHFKAAAGAVPQP